MIKNTQDFPLQSSLPEALCTWDKKPCHTHFVCAIWYFPKQIFKNGIKDHVVASSLKFDVLDSYDYLDFPFCSLSCVKKHIQSQKNDSIACDRGTKLGQSPRQLAAVPILYEHALYLTMQLYHVEKIEIN